MSVADKSVDNIPLGRLRGLYEWLTGVAASPPPSPSVASDPTRGGPPAHIAHYTITRALAAFDEAGGERLVGR